MSSNEKKKKQKIDRKNHRIEVNWLIVLLYTVALGDYIVFLLVIFINYSNDYFVSFQIVLSRFESILDRRNCCKSETFEKNRTRMIFNKLSRS